MDFMFALIFLVFATSDHFHCICLETESVKD